MASHKVLPLGVLDKCVDKHVWILMKGQREFGGTLRGFDDFFNMVLQDATEVWVDNNIKEYRKHETILLNGHDVAFVLSYPLRLCQDLTPLKIPSEVVSHKNDTCIFNSMNRNQQYFSLALIFTILAIFWAQTPSQISFDQWAAQFLQQSTLTDNDYRRIVFQANYADILAHNANPFRTFDKGLNQFSHLTPEQFRQMYIGLSFPTSPSVVQSSKDQTNLQTSLGDVDWEVLGKISPVKNQGNCDAGYAFCSVGLTESSYLFATTTVILSEQQIIDCSANYTTFGCQGGSRNGTLKYIRQQGINVQSLYPFKGAKGNCLKSTGNYKLPKQVEALGCTAMRNALENSPLTVAVNALQWMTYRSGIFDNCSSTEVNHDVLLVGATLYNWRIKNSWGVKWGEYGYIRLKLGNTCGICLNPAFGFQ